MQEQPLVSVIIPNYNYGPTLGPCLDAVRQQTYPAIETIVSDDGSTDESVTVARQRGVTLLESSVNSGVSVARNRGAHYASGDILFFLDSDVALDPEAVAEAVRILHEQPQIGAICGMYRPEPMPPENLVKRYRAIQQYVWFSEVEGPIPGLHSALFAMRTEVFHEVGDFNDRLRWTEEQDYGFRLNARYEVWATQAIRGRHDHDATLGVLLTKVFQRTRLGAPNWLRLNKLPGGAGTGFRALGSGFVLAGLLALPLTFLFGWWTPVVAMGLLTVGVALDGRTYGHAFRHHDPVFGLAFSGIHLAVTSTSGVAAGIGILQGLLFPRMVRRLYGTERAAVQ